MRPNTPRPHRHPRLVLEMPPMATTTTMNRTRPCNHIPGDHDDNRHCPDLTDHPTGKCPRHRSLARKASRERNPRDPAQNRFYASPEWAAIRARVLAEQPLCRCGPQCCPNGCRRPSRVVDHVDGNWRNNARENHVALAKKCHDRKTARTAGFTPSSTSTPRRRQQKFGSIGM